MGRSERLERKRERERDQHIGMHVTLMCVCVCVQEYAQMTRAIPANVSCDVDELNRRILLQLSEGKREGGREKEGGRDRERRIGGRKGKGTTKGQELSQTAIIS